MHPVARRGTLALALLAPPPSQGADVSKAYERASGGTTFQLSGSEHHLRLDRKGGGAAAGTVRIVGPATLRMNPSGGSDTISLGNAAHTEFYQLTLEPDDRAAVMFSTGRPYPGVRFYDCRIGLASGTGWNAETDSGFRGKWGVLSYQLDDFLFQGGEVTGIGKEHCFYHHNPSAPTATSNAITIRGVTMKWARRTAVQVVSRVNEGPNGRGNILIEDCRIEDVCLEDGGGGSALTFRGNLDGSVLIRNTRVALGGNPRLHPRVQANITGALVMDAGQGAQSRGTTALIVDGCHFEVGPHYTGRGSARRPNMMVSEVGSFVLRATRVINHPGASAAMSLDLRSIGEVLLDVQSEVRGDCELAGVGVFPDPGRTGQGYRDLLRAASELPANPGNRSSPRLLGKVKVFDSAKP